jgi:hypothetical protein
LGATALIRFLRLLDKPVFPIMRDSGVLETVTIAGADCIGELALVSPSVESEYVDVVDVMVRY